VLARRRTTTALMLIDVVNAFDFEGSEGIVRAAERAAPNIEHLAERARANRVPVIYVNDNFGQWRSDFQSTVRACAQADQPGWRIVRRLRPHDGDYFVLKPQHSAFYSTVLELLLEELGTRTLVLAGFAANFCVLFTANDAHMRGYRLVVPTDCTASNRPALTRDALRHIKSLGGSVRKAVDVDFADLAKWGRKPRRSPLTR
jgi:nicotinamidase-related amidase